MGLGNFFKTIVSAEAMGDEIIRLQLSNYQKVMLQFPAYNHHQLLMQVWLDRLAARGIDTKNDALQDAVHVLTSQFACLRYPANISAMSHYMVLEERPDMFANYPRFEREFERLMQPFYDVAMDEERLTKQYSSAVVLL